MVTKHFVSKLCFVHMQSIIARLFMFKTQLARKMTINIQISFVIKKHVMLIVIRNICQSTLFCRLAPTRCLFLIGCNKPCKKSSLIGLFFGGRILFFRLTTCLRFLIVIFLCHTFFLSVFSAHTAIFYYFRLPGRF